MADDRENGGLGYGLFYVVLSAGILAIVWMVVTRALPPRLVPNASFREQATRFSTEPPAFDLPPQLAVAPASAEPVTTRAPRDTATGPRLGARGRLWRDVGPLLQAGQWEHALPRLRAFLDDHPGDAAVRLELARALARSGREDEAEVHYRRLAAEEDLRGTVGLANLLWRQGRLRPAAEQFRRALERDSDDETMRRSLARVLRTMGDYREAASLYRTLIRDSDSPAPYRVELARTLLWAGEPLSALTELRRAETLEASELTARIEEGLSLPFPDPVVSDPLARSRRARRAGDAGRAAALYAVATDLRPRSLPAWLEWAEVLAVDLETPARAVRVLEEALGRVDGRPRSLLRRLARYSVWSGDGERASSILAELASEGEATPGDLAVLADLHRWADDRRRADDVYGRVLASPEADSTAVRRAERGMEELRARDRQVVRARDPRRAEVNGSRFDDSDGFARTGLRGEAWLGTGSGLGRFLVAAEWFRLDGSRVSGHESGGGIGVGWVRWLEHATARVELRAGREARTSGIPAQTGLSGELLLLDRGVDRLGLGVTSRPAHEVTQSLASLRRGQLATGAYFRLGHAANDATYVDASVRGDVIHGGSGERNIRLLGTGSWLRSVSRGVRIGVATRLLAYTSPAFDAGGRPGYWSPELSLTPSAVADLRLRPEGTGVGLHARLQPGLSVVDEHGPSGTRTGSSIYALGGLFYRWPAATAEADVSWIRSRAGEYDALSATFGLTWRF